MEKPDYKDYEHSSSRDLICDPYFQQWVIDPQGDEAAFWREFLLRYPGAQEKVQQAKAMLGGLAFREEWPAEGAAEASFDKVATQLSLMPESDAADAAADFRPDKKLFFMHRKWWAVAAAALFAGIVLLVVMERKPSVPERIAHQTRFGKKERVVLPDGSVVMLNANSTIEYADSWKGQAAREVWLKGEAYFQVSKVQLAGGNAFQPFRVHTDNLTVDVLGTTFDVRERRGITEVVLATGKIELVFRNPAHGRRLMQPGDRVLYDPQQQKVQQDTTNAKDFSAWQHNKLILKEPTVKEIIRYLEDNFGQRIILEDPRMASRTISGPILYDSLNDALFILSTVLNTQVIKQDSSIILRPRK